MKKRLIMFIFVIMLTIFMIGCKNKNKEDYENKIIYKIADIYNFENYTYVIEEVKINDDNIDYACFIKMYGESKTTSTCFTFRLMYVDNKGNVYTERLILER